MAGKLTEARWRLAELLFRLYYRVMPDKDALDFVMRHGILGTREAQSNAQAEVLFRAALEREKRPLPLSKEEGK